MSSCSSVKNQQICDDHVCVSVCVCVCVCVSNSHYCVCFSVCDGWEGEVGDGHREISADQ